MELESIYSKFIYFKSYVSYLVLLIWKGRGQDSDYVLNKYC